MIIVYIILIAWLLWLVLPVVSRWLMRRAARSMQRKFYEQMGIDPGIFEGSQGGKRKTNAWETGHRESARGGRRSYRTYGFRRTKTIPEEYGEYITFTVLELTGDEPWLTCTSESPVFKTYVSETQISDAKWTEYK